jgi:hypothetical protein
MNFDPTLLSPVLALIGVFNGESISLIAAIYIPRSQDRIPRTAAAMAKRKTVFADFVFHVSNLTMRLHS